MTDPARATALERYVRLEAIGFWRQAPDAEALEVVVSFGRSTLVLAGLDDKPLGHWALGGIRTIDRAGDAVVYAMTPEGYETLAIRDPEMNEAIAAVTAAGRGFPTDAPRRARWPIVAAAAAALAVVVAWAAPPLLHDQAARMLPPEIAERFGGDMLLHIVGRRGAPCFDPSGAGALSRLAERIAGTKAPPVRLIDLGGQPVAVLPGGMILLDRSLPAAAESADEIAGWIAYGMEVATWRPPGRALMEAAGALSSLGFILTGRLSDLALARGAAAAVREPRRPAGAEISAAERIQGEPAAADPVPPAAMPGLARRLAAADLPASPIAHGLRRTGSPIAAEALLAQPTAPAEGRPALHEADWAALRTACS